MKMGSRSTVSTASAIGGTVCLLRDYIMVSLWTSYSKCTN